MAAGCALIAAYLLFEDRRLARTVETTEHGIHFRSASGRVRIVLWNQISEIVNHPASGFLHISTATGEKLTLAHQFENVQTLVREIAAKTGQNVEERD